MADALDSGSSGSNPVRVQVPFSAFFISSKTLEKHWFSRVFLFLKYAMEQTYPPALVLALLFCIHLSIATH